MVSCVVTTPIAAAYNVSQVRFPRTSVCVYHKRLFWIVWKSFEKPRNTRIPILSTCDILKSKKICKQKNKYWHNYVRQVVKQMPTLCSSRQPSIAVITALYCEKQAVDAMMDNQETYVRYTTVGESAIFFPMYCLFGYSLMNLFRSIARVDDVTKQLRKDRLPFIRDFTDQ